MSETPSPVSSIEAAAPLNRFLSAASNVRRLVFGPSAKEMEEENRIQREEFERVFKEFSRNQANLQDVGEMYKIAEMAAKGPSHPIARTFAGMILKIDPNHKGALEIQNKLGQ